MDEETKESVACAYCGHPENEHVLLNFSDGNNVGKAALLCPTSTFLDSRFSEVIKKFQK